MERLLKESAGFACLVQPCIPQRGGTVLSHAGSDPHAYVGRMRERFFVALAVTGGAYAIAFVNPSWVSSTKRSSSRQYGGAQTLALDIDSYMIPHPDKAATGGEDACFVLEHDFGVFDGVGGWAALGYDPGIFTRGFAKIVAANVTAGRVEQAAFLKKSQEEGNTQRRISEGINLKRALEDATARAPGKGTCTACVVTFDPVYGLLNGVNVGDSGALLVRRDARGVLFVALRSATQRHRFNQPYQLGTGSKDRAEDAQPFLFYVREGDVVVLATDGMLDNLYDDDILECISELTDSHPDSLAASFPPEAHVPAGELAGALARRAFQLSQEKDRVTPWEDEAVAEGVVSARGSSREASLARQQSRSSWGVGQWAVALERAVLSRVVKGLGLEDKSSGAHRHGLSEPMTEEEEDEFRGGKMDDITVVVATVQRAGRKAKAAKLSGKAEEEGLATADNGDAHTASETQER